MNNYKALGGPSDGETISFDGRHYRLPSGTYTAQSVDGELAAVWSEHVEAGIDWDKVRGI